MTATPHCIYQRYLHMQLPRGQSTFLWGARKTGKSFYLKRHYPNAVHYDLLKTDEYFRLLKQPHLLREEVLALSAETLEQPIIIDEVQKIPLLLNEVHWLIENTAAYFILCGSSARKLRATGINLLGGRAWRYDFYPLSRQEIPDFNLLQALQNGLIPSHYLATNWLKTIKAYVNDYLKHEIQEEGLTRNLRAFAEFLDVSAFSNGMQINYSNIARDCGVDAKTIKEYYQILVDTLLGYYVLPFTQKRKRSDITATPKFYFFDVGIVNGISKRIISQLKGDAAGAAFEHYILMELIAYRGLNDLDFVIDFWRTSSGLEVDFVLHTNTRTIAVEIKISQDVPKSTLNGILHFTAEYAPERSIVVCQIAKARKLQVDNSSLDILPWQQFLQELWAGKII